MLVTVVVWWEVPMDELEAKVAQPEATLVALLFNDHRLSMVIAN